MMRRLKTACLLLLRGDHHIFPMDGFYIRIDEDVVVVKVVRFHHSYSYEDFIQGYRPGDDSFFRPKNGIFETSLKRLKKIQSTPMYC